VTIISKVSEKAYLELTDDNVYRLHGTWYDWHVWGIYTIVELEKNFKKLVFIPISETEEQAKLWKEKHLPNVNVKFRKRIDDLTDTQYEELYNQIEKEKNERNRRTA